MTYILSNEKYVICGMQYTKYRNFRVKDVMNTIILGTGGKLFPYKETVSEISFPELDNFAAAYKKIAPKYSVAIDAKIRQVYELSAKQALKPVEASIIFNSMYEIIYQEVGASRKWNVKEYGIVKPILKNYGTLTSAKMFLLFLADIEKYFRNGSPNIATFNYCKDRLYLDVKGKLAGKKQLKNNTFTYD